MPTTASPNWFFRHLPKLLIALLAVTAASGAVYLVKRKTPEDYLANAQTLRDKGELQAAMIETKSALQLAPDRAEVRLLLGQLHYAANDFASAEKELTRAMEMGARKEAAVLALARVLIAMRNPDRLVSELTLPDTSPLADKAALQALRAKAQFMQGDSAGAEASLIQADGFQADHPDTLHARAQILQAQEHPEEALSQIDKALTKDTKNADYWATKGELHNQLKQPKAAVEAFAKALTIAPTHINARLALVQGHIDNKAMDDAEKALKPLRAQAPKHLIGIYLEGLIDLHRQRFQESLGKAQNVLQSAPDAKLARLLAGASSAALGKHEEAMTHLNQVLQVDPENSFAKKLLATSLLEVGQTDRARAILDTMHGLADDPSITSMRGNILLREGDFAAARSQFAKAVESGSTNANSYVQLAVSEAGLGNVEAMLDALGKAAHADKTTKSDLLLINGLIKTGRFDEALRAVDTLAKKQAPAAMPHNLRGVIHSAKKDTRQARASFEAALKADPKNLEAATNLANLDILDKNFKSAQARFEAIIQQTPNYTDAHVALAKIAMTQQADALAREHLEKAKKLDPNHIEARQLLGRYWLGKNNPGIAIQEAREGLAATKDTRFHELIGLSLSQQGDHKGALAAFERWANDQPNSAQAMLRLGQAQATLGKRKDALRSLDRALASNPEHFDALSAKAGILVEEGRAEEAVKLARDLQVRQPNQAAGYMVEGNALLAARKPGEAAPLLVKAATLSGKKEWMVKAAQAYSNAGNHAESARVLNTWLQTHPGDTPVRGDLALILERAGKPREAADQYRQLLRANPQDVAAQNNLAMVLLGLKDPGAVTAAEQAYKLAADNPMVMDTLGWVLVHNSQGARGIKLIKQAFDKQPNNLEFHWHYAKGLAVMGEPVLARHELESFLAKGKTSPWGEEARKLLETLKR